MAISFTDLDLEDPTEALRSEVARLRTIVASMEQSRSWKITRPLRSFAKWSRLYRLQQYREKARKRALIIQQTPAERASEVVTPLRYSVPNVCGIAHIYYTDLADEIVEVFLRCGTLTSAVITTPFPKDDLLIDALTKLVQARPSLNIAILETENIGRDIYPFLQAIKHPYVAECDVFLKVHTKKSLHLDEYKGRNWRQQLLTLLTPDHKTTAQIAAALHHSNDVLLACPEKFAAGRESWGRNKKLTTALAKELGLPKPKDLVFAAGSMFWAKADLLTPLHQLDTNTLDFTHNSDQLDGSLPHAFERLFGLTSTSLNKPIWLFT
jgi:lipopolysaccharide biosynthesis protein